jgi:hypothetical protein
MKPKFKKGGAVVILLMLILTSCASNSRNYCFQYCKSNHRLVSIDVNGKCTCQDKL